MSYPRALGKRELPDELTLADGSYRRVKTLQHSFFAATGLYEGPGGKKLFKVGREASLFGLPLRWLGRFLSRRELFMYEVCAGIEGVPSDFEVVTDTGFARPYIEGHPLERGERVGDDFFPRLQELLSEIHARELAFVDLQKAENVLVELANQIDRGRWEVFLLATQSRDRRLVPEWRELVDQVYDLEKHEHLPRTATPADRSRAGARSLETGTRSVESRGRRRDRILRTRLPHAGRSAEGARSSA